MKAAHYSCRDPGRRFQQYNANDQEWLPCDDRSSLRYSIVKCSHQDTDTCRSIRYLPITCAYLNGAVSCRSIRMIQGCGNRDDAADQSKLETIVDRKREDEKTSVPKLSTHRSERNPKKHLPSQRSLSLPKIAKT